MSRARRTPTEDLRLAIDCLPRHMREAMLEGVRTNQIIVGAYIDGDGGVCPMLAAHRCGGRSDFLSFARAWDRYAPSPVARRSRRATDREVTGLIAQLEASLRPDEDIDLGTAITEHQSAARERRGREAKRTGWGWLHRRTSEPESEPDTAPATAERELEPGISRG